MRGVWRAATAEVVLEKRYCQENGLTLGDEISLGGELMRIVGIGSVPDYDAPFKDLADSSVDSKNFGLAFVCEGQYESLKARSAGSRSESYAPLGARKVNAAHGRPLRSESYTYAYGLNERMGADELKELLLSFDFSPDEVKDPYFFAYLSEMLEQKAEPADTYLDLEIDNLTQFLTAEDNPRIGASADDQVINKVAGYIAGVIVLILFSYVISVFIIHNIEKESGEIGALYALGVRKRELILHYLMLPVIITFISGIVGTVAGFSPAGLNVQLKECYNYFSLPELSPVYSPLSFVYGMLMPPVTAVLVNTVVMNKKLSRPALALIRKEPEKSRTRSISLGQMGFISRFRIRQMLREARSTGAVLFGMFIALLVMMIGVDCYVLCSHISVQNKADTKFEYMYTYKYPQPQVPDGGGGRLCGVAAKGKPGIYVRCYPPWNR